MKPNHKLETYWITFPQDPHLPLGIGVTALSQDDALELIRAQGMDRWYSSAREVRIETGVRFADLDRNVAPNIGPMQLRGVWYPVANIGYGAPRDAEYKPLSE